MIDDRPESHLFEVLSRELLEAGRCVRFQARGASMSPAIRDGEIVHVRPVFPVALRRGDVVLAKTVAGFRLHRLVVADAERDIFVTRGDAGQQDDHELRSKDILGIAVAQEVRIGRRSVQANLKGPGGRLLRGVARGQRALLAGARLLRRRTHRR